MAGPHVGDPLTLPDDGVDYLGAAESMRRDFRVAYSPNLGDFPVDTRVAEVVRSATEALSRNGDADPGVEAFLGSFLRPHGIDRPAAPRLVAALEELAAR